jgi:hypothetical protein
MDRPKVLCGETTVKREREVQEIDREPMAEGLSGQGGWTELYSYCKEKPLRDF